MRRNPGKALALVLLLVACGQQSDSGDGPDGGTDGSIDSGPNPNPNSEGCPDELKLIYVIDQSRSLLQFNPMTKSFTSLGTLPCQPSEPNPSAPPFKMAIARDATAWVAYTNGELFRVEVKNNLACTKSPWVPNTNNIRLFSMGFSTDQVGGTTDTLFIAGGAGPTSGGRPTLAKLDLSTFQPTTVGSVPAWSDLTGTGRAELWGFFPSPTDARIAKLNKASGAVLQTYRETVLDDPDPDAWAFAFHGGSFWVFLQKTSDDQTFIYQFDASTGAQVGERTDAGTDRTIIAAGVSTCAPVIL